MVQKLQPLVFLILLSVFGLSAQQTIQVGDYASTKDHFEGSVHQKAPFNFDYKTSRSQQIYTANDLMGLKNKEIKEIRFRISAETMVVKDNYTVALKLYLSKTKEDAFKLREGEQKYRWMPIDEAKDLYMTKSYTINFLEITSGDMEYELVCKLDRPFLYTGGSILMTMSSQTNEPLGDCSNSYVDFFCFPHNVKGYPVRTLYFASDKVDVTTAAGYGDFSDGSGLKQRAVLKITYQNAAPSEDIDPIHPKITIEAGGLEAKLSGIDVAKIESLTVKGAVSHKDIAYIQGKMSKIATLDLSEAVCQDNKLPDQAFNRHPLLKEIVLPKTLRSIGQASLSAMPSLESVRMGGEVEEIDYNAFALSTKLRTIVWSKNLRTIKNRAFKDCMALSIVELPESVSEIGGSTFDGCTSLESFTSPKSLKRIPRLGFNGCKNLKKIVFGEQIEELEYAAFKGCTALQSITVNRMSPPTVGRETFGRVETKNLVLLVPGQAVEAYRKAEVWKDFGKISAISSTGQTYTVTYQDKTNGGKLTASVSDKTIPSGSKLEEQTPVKFSAIAAKDSALTHWVVNGVKEVASKSDTTIFITRDLSVAALFAPKPILYTITYSAQGKGGSIAASIDGKPIASGGKTQPDKTVRFEAKAEKNYHLKQWVINGAEVKAEGNTKEIVVTRNLLVEAVFERDILHYDVTIMLHDNNGKVTAKVDGNPVPLRSKVREGATLRIDAEADDHYKFSHWIVNGREVKTEGNTLEIVVDKSMTIEAAFERIQSATIVDQKETTRCYAENGSICIRSLEPIGKISVYDLTGRIVFGRVCGESSCRIALARGLYLVRIGSAIQRVLLP